MTVDDLWLLKDGETPSKRHGRGKRWRVRVTGHPARSFRTKAEAQRHDLRLRTETNPSTTATITVAELLDLWLEGKQGLSTGGLGAVKAASVRVRARWGGVEARVIEQHDVQAWVAGMTAVQRRKGLPAIHVPAAYDTRAKALQCLSGALAIAVAREDIKRNPCTGVKVGRPQQHDARFLDVDELTRVAEAAGRHWAPVIWLLGSTGVRIGECCRLVIGDIDAKRGRLRVRRSKSGKARDAPLTGHVLAMLDLARPARELLFLAPRGGPVDRDNFRARVLKPAAEKAGLPDLRIHDLRHTAASLMIASGASIKDVQAALGHKSAKMTLDLYGHRFEGHLADLTKRMDSLFGSADSVPGGVG